MQITLFTSQPASVSLLLFLHKSNFFLSQGYWGATPHTANNIYIISNQMFFGLLCAGEEEGSGTRGSGWSSYLHSWSGIR